MKKENQFWSIIFIFYIIILLLLSISRPVIPFNNFTYEGKIIHFIVYFIAADLFGLSVYKRKKDFFKITFIVIIFSLPLLTELLHILIPYRVFDVNDIIANYLGLTTGFIFFLFKVSAFQDKKE